MNTNRDGARKDGPLAGALTRAPKLSSPRLARERVAELADEPGAGDAGLDELLCDRAVRALLEGVADHSAYLWSLARRDVPRLARMMRTPPADYFEESLARLRERARAAVDEQSIMRALREAKHDAALHVALADLGGAWGVVEVTRALTRFADDAVSSALEWLLRREALAGRLAPPDVEKPRDGCGMVVLALGKHGAGELNYSSDIDLVVLYDAGSAALPADAEPGPLFVRVARALTRLLHERTEDGYVLRVDLRLRPDPGSTAIAISTQAATHYYETLGQNWERAAMIKARPVAGDIALGAEFLAGLAPFIWRKYFDYAAIADIHAMKRQIHAVRGHAEVAVAGHDVKLGRGGIREVEFFVQTQQLIFGGKRVALRGARTLEMLVELHRDGWVTEAAVRDLTAAYLYLREIEHRLQMVSDEQTQRLPADPDALKRFARFCGFGGVASFSKRLTRHLREVEQHYARLFEAAPGLDSSHGSLVFTGTHDDPETLVTLTRMGFADPAGAAETVRGWHFGRRAAVQSSRAREVLTELVPGLLEAFGGSGDPDAALVAFDAMLTRMPAAIELLSILRSNKSLRELFGDILGGAPRLADVVVSRPHVLDAAIDPALNHPGRDDGEYSARAARVVAASRSTEEFLDAARDMAHEERFLVGVRMLTGVIDPARAGRAFSALGSAIVSATLEHVSRAFEAEHGRVESGRCVVLGMGKLGSREMTAASDLDLILIYDFDAENPESSGVRRLHATQYYARMTQRLVSALTVATSRGTLYEVDMRLRPSGNKGPVATQFRGFVDYQRNEAETWEHMALTRARVVCGDASLALEVEGAIHAVLTKPRDPAALRDDVFGMRRLIAAEKGESDPWDLKLAAGGLVDIEFIAQYFALLRGREAPEIAGAGTRATIARAARRGFLPESDGQTLREAHRLLEVVTQMQRLTIEGRFDPDKVARGVLRRVATVAGAPDFRALAGNLVETRAATRAIFDRLLGRGDQPVARRGKERGG